MVHRWLVVASLLVAATAHAQAPGDTPVQPPGETPMQPAASPPSEWQAAMAQRWSVGLALGSLGLTPKDQPDNQTSFTVGELALRYRARPHVELELALGGGDEKAPDGMPATTQVSYAVLDIRYRFAPASAWNWWLMGGLGALAVTTKDATNQQAQDARRTLGEVGVGVERRFHRFALDAELRAIGVGPDNNTQAQPVGGVVVTSGSTTMPTQQPPPPPPPTSSPMGDGRAAGAQLTIGASYYF